MVAIQRAFRAAWWHEKKWNGQDVYLQIEESRLCFKIATNDGVDRTQMRNTWKDQLLEAAEGVDSLNVDRPKRLGHGKWMTVAVVKPKGLDGYRIVRDFWR